MPPQYVPIIFQQLFLDIYKTHSSCQPVNIHIGALHWKKTIKISHKYLQQFHTVII